ncbi:hypothetical protein KIPB_001589 [Kipferlia bialata]|uniref:Methyltransferase type 11 domain-containing protein n=1 Tax=Kipferlia bialata TaxID=797122 RepID=A0A9K3CQ89_9EUKA|nr:hypothetical protein KIPB_001589 [Kipferlia bialata]|eukprot:g1589.t1
MHCDASALQCALSSLVGQAKDSGLFRRVTPVQLPTPDVGSLINHYRSVVPTPSAASASQSGLAPVLVMLYRHSSTGAGTGTATEGQASPRSASASPLSVAHALSMVGVPYTAVVDMGMYMGMGAGVGAEAATEAGVTDAWFRRVCRSTRTDDPHGTQGRETGVGGRGMPAVDVYFPETLTSRDTDTPGGMGGADTSTTGDGVQSMSIQGLANPPCISGRQWQALLASSPPGPKDGVPLLDLVVAWMVRRCSSPACTTVSRSVSASLDVSDPSEAERERERGDHAARGIAAVAASDLGRQLKSGIRAAAPTGDEAVYDAVYDLLWPGQRQRLLRLGSAKAPTVYPMSGKRALSRVCDVKHLLPSGFRPRAVADIGCADGAILSELARHYRLPPSSVYGIDVRPPTQSGAFTYIEASDDGSLGIPDTGELDLILIAMTLHHIPDWQSVLASAVEALAPGGWLVIREHDADDNCWQLLLDIHDGLFATCIYKDREQSWRDWAAVARSNFLSRDTVLSELSRLGMSLDSTGVSGRKDTLSTQGSGRWVELADAALHMPGLGDSAFRAIPVSLSDRPLYRMHSSVYYAAVQKGHTAARGVPTRPSPSACAAVPHSPAPSAYNAQAQARVCALLAELARLRDLRCHPGSYHHCTSRSCVLIGAAVPPRYQSLSPTGGSPFHCVHYAPPAPLPVSLYGERMPVLVIGGTLGQGDMGWLSDIAARVPLVLLYNVEVPPAVHSAILGVSGCVCIPSCIKGCVAYATAEPTPDTSRQSFLALYHSDRWQESVLYLQKLVEGKGADPASLETMTQGLDALLAQGACDADVYGYLLSLVPQPSQPSQPSEAAPVSASVSALDAHAQTRARLRAREIHTCLMRHAPELKTQVRAMVDVCSGDGLIAREVASLLGVAPPACVCVDIRQPDQAPGLTYIRHDMEAGPVRLGAFSELVLCMQALHHVKDIDSVLRSMYYSLRPGGIAIIKDVAPADPLEECLVDVQHGVYSCVGSPPQMSGATYTSTFTMHHRTTACVRQAVSRVGFSVLYMGPAGKGAGSPFWLCMCKPGRLGLQRRGYGSGRDTGTGIDRGSKDRHGKGHGKGGWRQGRRQGAKYRPPRGRGGSGGGSWKRRFD